MEQNQHSQRKPWATNFCEIFRQPGTVLLAALCPPIAYYTASEEFEQHPASTCEALFGGYCCCMGYGIRSRLRKHYGLSGSVLTDLCAHCSCHCLALARVLQEATAQKELAPNPPSQSIQSYPGYTMPVPVQPMMQQVTVAPPPQQYMLVEPTRSSAIGTDAALRDGGLELSETTTPDMRLEDLERELDLEVQTRRHGTEERTIDAKSTEEVIDSLKKTEEQHEASEKKPVQEYMLHMMTGTPDPAPLRSERKRDGARVRFERLRPEVSEHGCEEASSTRTGGGSSSARITSNVDNVDDFARELDKAESTGKLGTSYGMEVEGADRKISLCTLRKSVVDDLDATISPRGTPPATLVPPEPLGSTGTDLKAVDQWLSGSQPVARQPVSNGQAPVSDAERRF